MASRSAATIFPALLAATLAVASQPQEPAATLIPLTRNSAPVWHNGQLVSHKHTYSGMIRLGASQEFSVVFDTGSGHIVVPSDQCWSPACTKKRRYSLAASPGAYPINADNTMPVTERDEISISYGTGTIDGEFVRETVCAGPGPADTGRTGAAARCAELNVVVATEMSKNPFEELAFDGIFGLGPTLLSTTPQFSFFHQLAAGANPGSSQFGIYLVGGDRETGSELAIAGHNPKRLQGPLSWTPVASPELGFWQVEITGVRLGNESLDICKDGGCRGIVDTGSSHLGVPRARMPSLFKALSTKPDNPEGVDCRDLAALDLHIELNGVTLSLSGSDYMRKLPTEDYNPGGQEPSKSCRPRLYPVSMPQGFSPNTFVLGEPVLLRYYTVFEAEKQRIGFGLAANSEEDPDEAAAKMLEGDTIFMVQVTMTLTSKPHASGTAPLRPLRLTVKPAAAQAAVAGLRLPAADGSGLLLA
jgi:hypothetical protein